MKYLGGSFSVGQANGDQRKYDAGWERAFGGPRCDCGKKLGRLEVGLCAACAQKPENAEPAR